MFRGRQVETVRSYGKYNRFKMKTYIYSIGLFFMLCFCTACSESWEQVETPAADISEVRIGWSSYHASGGETASLPAEEEITSMKAYLFEGGVLKKVYEPSAVPGHSAYRLLLDRRPAGTLYVVANETPSVTENQTQEDDWLQTLLTADTPQAPLFFTGKLDKEDFASGQSSLPLTLTRGMARFDFRIKVAEEIVEVRHFAIRKVAQQGFLFPGSTVRSPEQVSKADRIICTAQNPLTRDSLGVCYAYEQVNPDLAVSLQAVIGGQDYRFDVSLPDTVRRNTVYAIILRKDVLDVEAELTVEDWGQGMDTPLYPDLTERPRVDVSASELPDGVEVAASADTVFLPYGPTEMVLAVACNDELELLSSSALLAIEPLPREGIFNGLQRFRIRKSLYPPNYPASEVLLHFRRKGMQHAYPDDVLALCLAANPSRISGKIDFTVGDYDFDFDRYIDNELAVFTLPPDKELVAEYEAGEDPWIKLAPVDGQTDAYRVLAGWKPNDPTANGRRQSVRLVIRNRDGSGREEYTVSRRNYGLPVIWFHGIWWCKYNARGRSRSFDDQILSSDDPARQAGQTLFQYLESCTADEFFDLWKWEYQGDSGEGLQVVDRDGKAVLDRYNHQVSVHINRLPADALSPEGYELPSMDDYNRLFDATDYVWVMWNGTHTLRTPWEGHSLVKRVQKRRNDVQVGSVPVSNLIYIAMSSPDFPEQEPIVWYGPASQWNDSEGIFHNGHYNNLLLGVHSPEGSGWFIAGGMDNLYLHKNAGSAKDTRVLRFRKSPVEYVYGVE